MGWTVLIPVKALPAAKSRLAADPIDPDGHAELVLAMRADTIDAALAAEAVSRVLLVADVAGAQPAAGVEEFVQSAPGLNAGLLEAAEHATRRWPGEPIAAVVADLPALRPAELDAALRSADALGGSGGFVRDHDGTGTTLLASGPDAAFRPAFGAGSAARHAALVPEIAAGPGLRQDVDTPDDLRRAAELGVGVATSRLIALVMPSSS